MNTFLALLTLSIILGVASNPVASPEREPPYSELDKAIDQILLGIEQSIKSRNVAEFSKYFHREFDAHAWYNRYYSQQTDNELATWATRRFGKTVARDNGQFEVKVSESHFNGNKFLLRSLLVVTKPDVDERGLPKPYAIVQATRYGAY